VLFITSWIGFESGANHSTRAFKLVANKHIIARINVLLDQVKRDNSISISWTPAHTNSDDPLAQGSAEADKFAARGCAAPHLLMQFRPPALAPRSSTAVVPLFRRPRSRSRSGISLVRSRSERPTTTPRRDPRLPPFDSRQPLSWRAFFRRLARRFRSLTRPAFPVHDYNGDLVAGD